MKLIKNISFAALVALMTISSAFAADKQLVPSTNKNPLEDSWVTLSETTPNVAAPTTNQTPTGWLPELPT